MTGHFSKEALNAVAAMFAEPSLEGECDQKAKRKAQAKPRTPAQKQADQARSQALRGKDNMGGNRSAAAKKAAETRSKCKGGPSKPSSTA